MDQDGPIEGLLWGQDLWNRRRPLEYLIYPYLVKGCLNGLAGYPGSGKTSISIWLAAGVTKGELTVPGRPPILFPPGRVLYCGTEDQAETVWIQRVERAGANMRKIHRVPKTWSLATPEGREHLYNLLRKGRFSLVIFDPAQNWISGINMNTANETAPILEEVSLMCEELNIVGLAICHTGKTPHGKGIQQFLGSTDIIGKFRSGLISIMKETPKSEEEIEADPDGGCLHKDGHLIHTKVNEGTEGRSLRYTWIGSSFLFTGFSPLTKLDLEPAPPSSNRTDNATEWLEGELAGGEFVPSHEIMERAKSSGFKPQNIYNAARKLGERLVKKSNGRGRLWGLESDEKTQPDPHRQPEEIGP